MKKLILFVAFLATAFAQESFAQDSTDQKQLTYLLTQYYQLKDALVAGDGKTAATSAGTFIKTLNGIDYKVISEGNANALLKDATAISASTDINKQRLYFANFSANMIALAKSLKLSAQPVYEVYCPMKKASWLSSSQAIRNPYYGSSMLTCGKVVSTIGQ